MSEVQFLIEGFLIGFAIAAPVGPIGVLCIRRTLADGRLVGFLSGIGAATADMLYGAIAAFGITAVQRALVNQQLWLQLLGGLFLIFLGVRTFFSTPAPRAAEIRNGTGRLAAYLSTLVLTLTNPATILSFTVIFAGMRLGASTANYADATFVVMGVFVGSASWWLMLSSLVGAFRERFTPAWMGWVNRLAGIVILAFGVTAMLLR